MLAVLALTKALFLYIGLLLLVALGLSEFRRRRALGVGSSHPRGASKSVLVAGVAFMALSGVWVARNAVSVGQTSFSGRSGVVLYMRSLMNTLTAEEILGALHVWGPATVRRWSSDGTQSPAPAVAQPGGGLERLARHRESRGTTSLFWQAWDLQFLLQRQFEARGDPRPRESTDLELRHRAMENILARPARHVCMTPLFLYRGLWAFRAPRWILPDHNWLVVVTDALSACGHIALFGTFIWSFLKRDWPIFLAVALPTTMACAYAFMTHFIPRYSAPLIPMLVALICSCTVFVLRSACMPLLMRFRR